ncbi:MAG TPA: hypothetical protein VGM81_16435 [Burkholderiaceae bacterium]|jgi:hypothetical protein
MNIDSALLNLLPPPKAETPAGLNEPRATSPWQREMEKAQDEMWFQRSTLQGERDPHLRTAQNSAVPSHVPDNAAASTPRSAAAQRDAGDGQRAAAASPRSSVGAGAQAHDVTRTLQVEQTVTSAANVATSEPQDAPATDVVPAGDASTVGRATTVVELSVNVSVNDAIAPQTGATLASPTALNASVQIGNTSSEEVDIGPTEHEIPQAPVDKGDKPTPARAQESLRIYTEWNGQEAHVWVGKDGSTDISNSDLAQWVQESLGLAQYRLASLVCNGVQLVGEGVQSRRKPTASAQGSEMARPTDLHSPSTEPLAETPWQTSAR